MAEVKTKENNASVLDFINSVSDKDKLNDSLILLKLFEQATGQKAKMWGTSIIGFGKYHYKSEKSSQEADWMLTGFSPRNQAISIYLLCGANEYSPFLEKLGKYKVSGRSCLYVKTLDDIDLNVLKKLIKQSFIDAKKKFGSI